MTLQTINIEYPLFLFYLSPLIPVRPRVISRVHQKKNEFVFHIMILHFHHSLHLQQLIADPITACLLLLWISSGQSFFLSCHHYYQPHNNQKCLKLPLSLSQQTGCGRTAGKKVKRSVCGTSEFRAFGEKVVSHQHNDHLNVKRMTHRPLNTRTRSHDRL